MGTLTIVLSDEVERKLRETVSKRGSGKGMLSKIIEEALKSYLTSLERRDRMYKAYKDDELVAEAESLDELANMLRSKGIDPRGLKIISTEVIKARARSGYRIRGGKR